MILIITPCDLHKGANATKEIKQKCPSCKKECVSFI